MAAVYFSGLVCCHSEFQLVVPKVTNKELYINFSQIIYLIGYIHLTVLLYTMSITLTKYFLVKCLLTKLQLTNFFDKLEL